jgi:hypothetical protein
MLLAEVYKPNSEPQWRPDLEHKSRSFAGNQIHIDASPQIPLGKSEKWSTSKERMDRFPGSELGT